MATAKKAVKKVPAKKAGVVAKKAERPAEGEARTGKELVSYDEMLAKLSGKAQHEADREANTGAGGIPWMTTTGKNFSIGEEEDFGDSIQCVVVGSAFLNAWYDAAYVPGTAGVPACYAVAESEEDLAPMDNAPKPQSPTCAECPKNEWDTGPNGKGKACGNRRKLAILLLSDLDEGVVRPVMLSLPPTALKFWGLYVKAVNRQHKLPPSAVVTRFDFDSENPQPCPIPTFEGIVPQEIMGSVFEYVESGEGLEIVLEKMDTSGYVAPSAAKPRKSKLTKAPAKKAVAGRGRR